MSRVQTDVPVPWGVFIFLFFFLSLSGVFATQRVKPSPSVFCAQATLDSAAWNHELMAVTNPMKAVEKQRQVLNWEDSRFTQEFLCCLRVMLPMLHGLADKIQLIKWSIMYISLPKMLESMAEQRHVKRKHFQQGNRIYFSNALLWLPDKFGSQSPGKIGPYLLSQSGQWVEVMGKWAYIIFPSNHHVQPPTPIAS